MLYVNLNYLCSTVHIFTFWIDIQTRATSVMTIFHIEVYSCTTIAIQDAHDVCGVPRFT